MFEQDDVKDVVGSTQYIKDLETLENKDFSDYGPEDVLELNRARYVVQAARDAGDYAYADKVTDIRQEFFDPLERFDRKVHKYDDPNHPEKLYRNLDDREKTFLHYPAPPNHLLPGAEARGRTTVPQHVWQAADQDEFLKGQARLKAVGEGASQLAKQEYQNVKQNWQNAAATIGNNIDLGFDYKTVDEYADAVAFNITLAAEAMFETHGNDFNLDYGP